MDTNRSCGHSTPFVEPHVPPRLYLLTAPPGAGKTTFCRALAAEARAVGWDVAGVLSPPVFENGLKTGIRVQNLRTKEARLLAIASHLAAPPFYIPVGNWRFDPAALAWGNAILASCLPADLFIVDEVGPLELIRGAGWQNALPALRQGAYKIGIAVVRPPLLDRARSLYPQAQVLSLPQKAPRFLRALTEEGSHGLQSPPE